jgi:hypothetical protein
MRIVIRLHPDATRFRLTQKQKQRVTDHPSSTASRSPLSHSGITSRTRSLKYISAGATRSTDTPQQSNPNPETSQNSAFLARSRARATSLHWQSYNILAQHLVPIITCIHLYTYIKNRIFSIIDRLDLSSLPNCSGSLIELDWPRTTTLSLRGLYSNVAHPYRKYIDIGPSSPLSFTG